MFREMPSLVCIVIKLLSGLVSAYSKKNRTLQVAANVAGRVTFTLIISMDVTLLSVY